MSTKTLTGDWQDMPDGTRPKAGDRVTAVHEDGDQHIGVIKWYLPSHTHYGDEMPAVVTTADFTLPLLPRGAWGVTRLERPVTPCTTGVSRAAAVLERYRLDPARHPIDIIARDMLDAGLAGPELQDIVVEALAAAGDRSWALSTGPRVADRIRGSLLVGEA